MINILCRLTTDLFCPRRGRVKNASMVTSLCIIKKNLSGHLAGEADIKNYAELFISTVSFGFLILFSDLKGPEGQQENNY